jgi:exosortase/archaeosortase family protein
VLVGASLLLVFITILMRRLFLMASAYNYGPDAIEGTVHDVTGYAVLGLTLVGLLCLRPLFNLRFGEPVDLPDLKGHDAPGENPDSKG